jgi:DNA polymerase eta
LGTSIAAEYDAATVGDLWTVPLHDFQAKFGFDSGTWLYNVLRGVEHGEVAAKTDVKSMLSSKNFKPSLTKWEEVVSSRSYYIRLV